jgi:hypothetical protein
MPAERKYPFKTYNPRTGEWVESENGLMAARNRAHQHGELEVAREATKRLNRIRKEKGKEPLEMP